MDLPCEVLFCQTKEVKGDFIAGSIRQLSTGSAGGAPLHVGATEKVRQKRGARYSGLPSFLEYKSQRDLELVVL
jgi:hypothetical protein